MKIVLGPVMRAQPAVERPTVDRVELVGDGGLLHRELDSFDVRFEVDGGFRAS